MKKSSHIHHMKTLPAAVTAAGALLLVMTGRLAEAAVFFAASALFSVYYSAAVRKTEDRLRDDVISKMSHELKTPLNGIIGLNLLASSHISDPAASKEYIEKSLRAAQQLLLLVNDILDVSRFRNGHIDLQTEPHSLVEAVSEVAEMQRGAIENRGLEFKIRTDVLIPYAYVDRGRLEQAIQILLSYSLSLTHSGYINLTLEQKPADGDLIINIIEIRDSGTPVPKRVIRHAEECFAIGENVLDFGSKDEILGIQVCFLLIREMGGNAEITENKDGGNIFRIILPLKSCDCGRSGCRPSLELIHRKELRGINVLAADDNELNAEIINELLTDCGFNVTVAQDGREAVEIFKNSEPGHFKVILMDMQMPVMNGCEAAREIRSLKRADADSVRIFACTADVYRDRENTTSECRMDGFIPKPVDIRELIEKICSAV